MFTQSVFFQVRKKDHCRWAPGSLCACMSQHKLVKPLCETLSRQEGESQPQGKISFNPQTSYMVALCWEPIQVNGSSQMFLMALDVDVNNIFEYITPFFGRRLCAFLKEIGYKALTIQEITNIPQSDIVGFDTIQHWFWMWRWMGGVAPDFLSYAPFLFIKNTPKHLPVADKTAKTHWNTAYNTWKHQWSSFLSSLSF